MAANWLDVMAGNLDFRANFDFKYSLNTAPYWIPSCIVTPERVAMVHIKKVIIKGFKSYKDQTEFEDFHRNLNVIGTLIVILINYLTMPFSRQKWFWQI